MRLCRDCPFRSQRQVTEFVCIEPESDVTNDQANRAAANQRPVWIPTRSAAPVERWPRNVQIDGCTSQESTMSDALIGG